MERITRGMVERQVVVLNKMLKRPEAAWSDKPNGKGRRVSNDGHLFLSHDGPAFYRIAEIDNDHGGERHPFSNSGYSLREAHEVAYALRSLLLEQEMGRCLEHLKERG